MAGIKGGEAEMSAKANRLKSDAELALEFVWDELSRQELEPLRMLNRALPVDLERNN